MTGTHDLPTVAGWWRGRDIDWAWRLGERNPDGERRADRAARDDDRGRSLGRAVANAARPRATAARRRARAVVDAAPAHVGRDACELAIVPLEDLLGLVEQPNLPGTIDEHPNWRRRMPEATAAMLDPAGGREADCGASTSRRRS